MRPANEPTKAERKASLNRIAVADAAYKTQQTRLEAQAKEAENLAAKIQDEYAKMLGEYPGGKKGAQLQLLVEAFNAAANAADKSESAAQGFANLRKVIRNETGYIKDHYPMPIPLSMCEERVFALMRGSYRADGVITYGLHETMLKADRYLDKARELLVAAFAEN